MSEADKMFYETDYKNKQDWIEKGKINYEKYEGYKGYIKFKHSEKTICIDGNITMQELQAINMKCKELKWI